MVFRSTTNYLQSLWSSRPMVTMVTVPSMKHAGNSEIPQKKGTIHGKIIDFHSGFPMDFPWISHCNGADFHVGSPPSYTRIGLAVAPRKTASDGPRSNRWDLSHTPFPPKKISNKTLSYIILYSYIFMFIPPKNMLLVWWSIPTWEWVIFQNLLQLRQTITP